MFLKDINQNTITKLEKAGILRNEAKIETEILLDFVFKINKKDLILNPDKELPQDKIEIFNELTKKRIKEKIPVQYLVNKAYFMGEEFYVDENVLIPRPETEILVQEIIRHIELWIASPQAPRNDIIKIIDVGTGSGCIACMLAKNLPQTEIFAIDISEKALEVAKLNAKKLGVSEKINFIHSDILENIDIKFDIIVSNPPYISIKEKPELQQEVVLHEPHLALFADDEKGVSFYKKLAVQAKEKLNNNGILAVEIGFSQASDITEIFKASGFSEIKVIKDYNSLDRIVIAKNIT